MKKLIIVLVLLSATCVQATDKSYFQQMEKEVAALQKTQTKDEWLNKVAVFKKIAEGNKEEWLPGYYIAYSFLKAGMEDKNPSDADVYYDQALESIKIIEQLSSANSEISALKSWILSMKISIDPMGRGYALGAEANTLLSAAIVQDANNPRPYLLKGLAALYTPEEYGGSKKIAKELINESINKFTTFHPENSIMPNWGLEKAKKILEELK